MLASARTRYFNLNGNVSGTVIPVCAKQRTYKLDAHAFVIKSAGIFLAPVRRSSFSEVRKDSGTELSAKSIALKLRFSIVDECKVKLIKEGVYSKFFNS